MKIADICQRDIVTIDAEASIQDAAALMRAQHVGALVVTETADEQDEAVGIITDRDLVVEVLALDLDPETFTVGDLASRDLVAVPANASFGQAVTAMQEAGVRRLLVTGQEGQLAGLVSATDLLQALAEQLGGLAGALRVGIASESARPAAVAPTPPRPVFLPIGTPGMQQAQAGH